MSYKSAILICLCTAALLVLSVNVQAASVYWNVSSGDFSQGSNWSSGSFPGTGDTAFINNGGTALLGATAPPNNLGLLKIGSGSGTSGTLTQSSKTLTVTGEIWIGNGGGAATYNMSGGTLNAQSWFSVARHWPLSDPTGQSTVNFSGGTINKSGGSADVNIGERGTGAQGFLYMSGNAVFNVNAGNFVLGAGGSQGLGQGVVTLTDSAQINMNSAAWFEIGAYGSTGTLTVNNGTINLTTATPGGWAWYPQFLVGLGTGGGYSATGSVTMNGGTVNAGGWICVGREQATGTVTINEGILNKYDTEGDIIIGSGNPMNTSAAAGNGTWNQNGGTVYNPTRLILGQASGSGTFNLNGGLIQAAAISGGAGTSTFNFNGGTLQATGDNPAFLEGLNDAYVKEGGARIDTQGYEITIDQVLEHGGSNPIDGGLTKSGTGTLTLSSNATYTGNTTVTAGTLDALDITTPEADVSIAAGGNTLLVSSISCNGLYIGSGAKLIIKGSDGGVGLTDSFNTVPEPGTLHLLLAGILTLCAFVARRH